MRDCTLSLIERDEQNSRLIARTMATAVRNARNLDVWRARSAWYAHNGQTPRDIRTPEQQRAWCTRSEIVQREDGDFLRFEYHPDGVSVDVIPRFPEEGWPPIPCVEIDLGDVIFDWCKPDAGTRGDFEQRQARGESLGLGDAPGSARIIDELVRYETHERPLTEAVRAKYLPPSSVFDGDRCRVCKRRYCTRRACGNS